MLNLTLSAIEAALSHDWEKAVSLNKTIIKENKNDVDALNRLAYALMQIGKINEAKNFYKQILTLDRFNFIAQKNLERIKHLSKNGKSVPKSQSKNTCVSPNLFIEEAGKTKTVTLIHIAPVNVLLKQQTGDPVILYPKKHSIEIRDLNKTYLGALPDDLAFRIIRLFKMGNEYQACIKNVQKNCLVLFLRETKRAKKCLNQPSFLTINHEYSTSSSRLIKKSLKEEEDLDDEETSNEESDEEKTEE